VKVLDIYAPDTLTHAHTHAHTHMHTYTLTTTHPFTPTHVCNTHSNSLADMNRHVCVCVCVCVCTIHLNISRTRALSCSYYFYYCNKYFVFHSVFFLMIQSGMRSLSESLRCKLDSGEQTASILGNVKVEGLDFRVSWFRSCKLNSGEQTRYYQRGSFGGRFR